MLRLFLPFGCVWLLISCGDSPSGTDQYKPAFQSDATRKPLVIFGVPSLSFYETTNEFVAYLNKHLPGVQVRTIACITYKDYQDKLAAGYFDLTMSNGAMALDAEKKFGYSIIGKLGDDERYRGVIFVHKDSAVRTINDLAGRTITFSGENALAGTMMPLLFLHQNGLNVNKDIRRQYVSSLESCIMNVYMGRSSAGAAWLTVWEQFVRKRPEIRSTVILKWQTPPLVNVAVLLKNETFPSVRDSLKNLLFSMQDDPEGKRALEKIGVSRLEPATTETYAPLQQFLEAYKKAVH